MTKQTQKDTPTFAWLHPPEEPTIVSDVFSSEEVAISQHRHIVGKYPDAKLAKLDGDGGYELVGPAGPLSKRGRLAHKRIGLPNSEPTKPSGEVGPLMENIERLGAPTNGPVFVRASAILATLSRAMLETAYSMEHTLATAKRYTHDRATFRAMLRVDATNAKRFTSSNEAGREAELEVMWAEDPHNVALDKQWLDAEIALSCQRARLDVYKEVCRNYRATMSLMALDAPEEEATNA